MGPNVVRVKLELPVAVPPPVVTETPPVTAPGITKPTRVLPVFDTTTAVCPPMVKAVGAVKLLPVMVTNVPTGPDEGLNELMTGVVLSTNMVLEVKPGE